MRIVLLLNKTYAQDPRAQRQITALANRGHLLDVICFKDPLFGEPVLPGVTFHSFPLYRRRTGRLRYVVEFATYFAYCVFQCLFLGCRRRYAVMQIYVMPEMMILMKVVAWLLGIRLVTDWMDLGYELYQTKFGARSFDLFLWLTHRFEHLIIRWSDLVLVPNKGEVRALARRGVAAENVLVVMNSADERIFKAAVSSGPRRAPLRLIYNGTITYRNGADLAVAGAARAFEQGGEVLLTVVGEARELEALLGSRRIDGVERFTVFTGRIELLEVAKTIANNDIGLITTRDTPYTQTSVPTRIYEFGVMNKPVICADLEGIRDYFDDSCVLFHRPDDVADLARCIGELRASDSRCEQLAAKLNQRCREFSWKIMQEQYCAAVEAAASALSRTALHRNTMFPGRPL